MLAVFNNVNHWCCFFFSSRRRHTRYWRTGVQTCALPISYAGFTASQTAHGGQESTLLALYNTIHHFGGITVPPGYTDPLKFADGNPYGVSHVTGPTNDAPITDAELAALDHMAQRIIRIAGKLKNA